MNALIAGFGLGFFVALEVVLGVRTLWTAFRVHAGAETPDEVATPRRAFATALAGTASNPLTIASWAALFAAASRRAIGERVIKAADVIAGFGLVGFGGLLAVRTTHDS